jgi:uncharacterized membrane protein
MSSVMTERERERNLMRRVGVIVAIIVIVALIILFLSKGAGGIL